MASDHLIESHLLAGVDAPPLGNIAGMSVLTATAQHQVPFADRVVPFDDREVARETLRRLAATA